MLTLEDVEIHKIRYDAVGFFVAGRQLGHIHPGGHVDLPLPQEFGEYLIDNGVVTHHRIHDDHGWFTHKIEKENDIDIARWLIRLNHLLYEIKKRGLQDPMVKKEFEALEVCEVGRETLHTCVGRWLRVAA